ncbi:MAG: hypothetical protein RMI01_09985 [Thermodesulfovibrio sp.]|nr:hypothetical protein [Thermodesulfovibrio sp.]
MLEGKKVLVMSVNNPSKNPRPNRIIKFLANHGAIVDALSPKTSGDLKINREFNINELRPRLNERLLRVLLVLLRKVSPNFELKVKLTELAYGLNRIIPYPPRFDEYDIIVVEDIVFLPMAIRNRNKAKVLCDLREFYPLEFSNYFIFLLLQSDFMNELCMGYLKQCDSLITVSEGIAKMYKEKFDVSPEIIMSTPYYHDISPSINAHNQIKMVHHGMASPDRELERMIYTFKYLDDRFYLDFYLVGSQLYIQRLKNIAQKFYPRVKVLPPMDFDSFIPNLNKYDIGLYLLAPTNRNTLYSLPNKLFEFVQARLMVAIGPSPEMVKIVRKYDLGIIADNFEPQNLAEKLNRLKYEDILHYKRNSHKAAKILCYENESRKLLDIIRKLLS